MELHISVGQAAHQLTTAGQNLKLSLGLSISYSLAAAFISDVLKNLVAKKTLYN